jgi:hypothetical protein
VGDVPYCLLFGQLPRVGIAGVPLAQELIDQLATESELNKVIDIEQVMASVLDNAATAGMSVDVAAALDVLEPPAAAAASNCNDDDGAAVPDKCDKGDVDAFPASNGNDDAAAAVSDKGDKGDVDAVTKSSAAAATTGVSDYKTTGMSDITQWQEIMMEFRGTTLNHDYIRQMPLNKAVPVASHKGSGCVSKVESFEAAFLVRISK